MTNNRSVPTNIMLSHICYPDVVKASSWLAEAFGFQEHYRYGNPGEPEGAQVHLGDAWIMLKKARPGWTTPGRSGLQTQSVTIFVDDVEGHYATAKAAGARIVEELNETAYGEFQYGVLDHEGHHWLFSRHARDLSPSDWGATIR